MSEESTLSLGNKLSPEIQNKLQQLAGKPDTIMVPKNWTAKIGK